MTGGSTPYPPQLCAENQNELLEMYQVTNIRRGLVGAILLAGIVGAWLALDLGTILTLERLREGQEIYRAYFEEAPFMVAVAFFLAYVFTTAVSLPGAAVLTLAAGALFGPLLGTLLASFASSLGATLAYLGARWLLGDWVQKKFAHQVRRMNNGVERDGALYLFTLRLVPVVPFFAINLMAGLTTIRPWTFYWVSQAGMLAGTIVYVNAGAQIARVDSLGSLFSLRLLGALVLLALFPWLARGGVRLLQRHAVYRAWRRPRAFDRNLIVIGAGSAGLVSAYIAATVKASVTLVEKERMGGDCLNTGCVPSKALIKSAGLRRQARHLEPYGLTACDPVVDFPAVMRRVQAVIRTIEPKDSVERYAALGVDCRHGHARLLDPWTVEIVGEHGSEVLTARSIILATGAKPRVPAIPGLAAIAAADTLTSANIWALRELPRRLLVVGGGPIGCELAQSFARLGSTVTQVEASTRLMGRDEPEAAALIESALRADGVNLLLGARAERFAREDGVNVLYVRQGDLHHRLEFDRVLLALGRRANTEELGLDALGIETREDGTIATNAYLQTRYPNILACGDVAGPFQFTHTAAHQAWYAVVNSLFGVFRRFEVDYRVIPWTTFTDPEVAHVGLTTAQAEQQEIAVESTTYALDDLDRAIADGQTTGFVHVLTAAGSDRILGVTIVGADAGNMLQEYVLAMKYGLGLNKILATIHAYPITAEANKFAAGVWRKARTPIVLLRWVGRWHRWRRGAQRTPPVRSESSG